LHLAGERVRAGVDQPAQDRGVIDVEMRRATGTRRIGGRTAPCRPESGVVGEGAAAIGGEEKFLPPIVRRTRIGRPDEEGLAPVARARGVALEGIGGTAVESRPGVAVGLPAGIHRRGTEHVGDVGRVGGCCVIGLFQRDVAAGGGRIAVERRGKRRDRRSADVVLVEVGGDGAAAIGIDGSIGSADDLAVAERDRAGPSQPGARARIMTELGIDGVRVVGLSTAAGDRPAKQAVEGHRTRQVDDDADVAGPVHRLGNRCRRQRRDAENFGEGRIIGGADRAFDERPVLAAR